MFEAGRDLLLQDAFKVGLISTASSGAFLGCLVWDTSPEGADVQVDPAAVVPDIVRLSIASLKIDRRCAVLERNRGRLHLAFVR